MPTHWKKLTNPDYLGAYAFDPDEWDYDEQADGWDGERWVDGWDD